MHLRVLDGWNYAGQQRGVDLSTTRERSQSARPASAAPRSRRSAGRRAVSAKPQHSSMYRINSIPPSQWNSVDVGTWICSIGMGQYKKKFLHNQVDGSLLMALDIGLLKQELSISPLGHRVTIYDAITHLRACDPHKERSISPATRQGLAKGAKS